jgi:hypothetical protein
MSGAILPLPQYAFMEWYLDKHRDNSALLYITHLTGCSSKYVEENYIR